MLHILLLTCSFWHLLWRIHTIPHSIMFAMRLEKYPQPLQFGFGSRLNAREIEKCKIILQPNWAPLSLPSYSNLGTKMWKFAASPKIGARHCGVFHLPWWARRIFFTLRLREGVNGKKRFLSGIARMRGVGVYPCPNFLALFLEVHFWSIKRVYFFKNANVLNF